MKKLFLPIFTLLAVSAFGGTVIWTNIDVDEMTDDSMVFLHMVSGDGLFTYAEIDGEPQVVLSDLSEYIGEGNEVALVRFDKNDAFQFDVTPSTDGKHKFVSADILPILMHHVLNSSTMVLRLYKYDGTALTYSFNLYGYSEEYYTYFSVRY